MSQQRHGNNAGRESTPHFALIMREENLHRILPPLQEKCPKPNLKN
ncbi:MAG: hypothetical protein KI793_28280 [Rivularia sp. (in: Bacteria)]|nr:hypothetical protein [Rivularia sp. MS3]